MLNAELARLTAIGRSAVKAKNWPDVYASAKMILKRDGNSPEGHFLKGLADKAGQHQASAARSFRQALNLDSNRYDAAIELAHQYLQVGRNSEAMSLLERYKGYLGNSPLYLDLAAATYSRLGLHESAWELRRKACDLQPEIQRFQENLAASGVLLGRVEEAKRIYTDLLERYPKHRRNHYEYSKLVTATDTQHIDVMKAVLAEDTRSAEENIFLYYALGKELEDIGLWNESFEYYKRGGDAAKSVSGYDVSTDLDLIDLIISIFDQTWIANAQSAGEDKLRGRTPIFIVGLPRTGTTLVERIISSHSEVQSIDETHFIEMALKKCSGIACNEYMSAAVIKAAAAKHPELLTDAYMNFASYRLAEQSFFVDKYPENFSYAGFIARAFPKAKIVQVTRHPMDACFAMYKQSYFRYAYSMEDLGRYYVAYRRLQSHWESVLGDRLTSVSYESLVAEQETETRKLLENVGLPFEDACLNFDENQSPSATASTVQVREKIHSRSVGRWKHFAEQLSSLREYLEAAGITVN